jgi:hypothetical protein
MAWLVGHWRGDGLGGRSEEVWSPAERGVMIGMYRNTKDGSAVFYEFLTLREEASSLVFRLKHFNPDMTGWEEKDESRSFEFVGHKGGVWHFEGMAFKHAGPDAVTIYLAIEDKKTETVREVEFHYKRVTPPLTSPRSPRTP